MVEQGTHKPLVGSSTLPPGSFAAMASVYILRASSGRHYIGSCVDLNVRFAQHLRGHTATTKRLGSGLEVVAKREVPNLEEARRIERALKRKKTLRSRFTTSNGRAAPNAFGVGREFDSPPGTRYSLGFARYGARSLSPPRTAAMKQTPLCSVTAPVQPS